LCTAYGVFRKCNTFLKKCQKESTGKKLALPEEVVIQLVSVKRKVDGDNSRKAFWKHIMVHAGMG
jgi:hypothetical protein